MGLAVYVRCYLDPAVEAPNEEFVDRRKTNLVSEYNYAGFGRCYQKLHRTLLPNLEASSYVIGAGLPEPNAKQF